jgi:hypothetical protein
MSADENAAVEQKVQRTHACRMGPFCLHRAIEVAADNEEKRDSSQVGMTSGLGMTLGISCL